MDIPRIAALLAAGIALGCSGGGSPTEGPSPAEGTGSGADSSPAPTPEAPTPPAARIPPCPPGFTLPFEVDPALYPFEPRCYDHPDGRMLAVDTGPGPSGHVVVFVHGNPTWSVLWADLMAHAADEGHRVVAFDHLGFGRSDKPPASAFDYSPGALSQAAEDLIKSLDLKDITLVVHDWGGPIGLGMAGRMPERIGRLLITNTWGWPIDPVAPGVYHRLWDWSTQAHTQARIMTDACLVSLYSARWIAQVSDPDRGALYDAVYEAYAAPWVDLGTGEPLADDVCWPTVSLAQAILDDPTYLGSVRDGLARLKGRPVSFVFGQGDDLLGALRCDIGEEALCPEGMRCVCDERYLGPGESCDDALQDDQTLAWLCQRPDGSVPMPALEDFITLLGEENVVGIDLDWEAEHFVQVYDGPKRALPEALDALIDAR